MQGFGSGNNGELTFLDTISLISFCIALQNLELNITQEDVQNVAADFDKKLAQSIQEIHSHLEIQDKKLDIILEELGHDNRRNLQ